MYTPGSYSLLYASIFWLIPRQYERQATWAFGLMQQGPIFLDLHVKELYLQR